MKYLNPDALFDVGHTYKKGGWIVHMIREYIGNENFKRSLKLYLERYKNSTAETDDIRQVFEEVSSRSLREFFDQWLFGKGHPQLDVKFSQDADNNVGIRIVQSQSESGSFNFPLDLKLVISTTDGRREVIERILEISQTESEKVFQIPKGSKVEWFSIDPYLKILKEIRSIDAPSEIFINQLRNRDSTTVIERIDAIRSISRISSDYKDIVDTLTKTVLEEDLSLDDSFWAVSLEAAKALSLLTTNDKIYDALMHCFSSVGNPKTKAVLVEGLRKFNSSELIEKFQNILDDKNESYYVQSQAARGFGKMADDKSISILEQIVETDGSFQNLVAQGAIVGLRIFATTKTKNQDLIMNIINLFIDKSDQENYENIRVYAVSSLGFFVSDKNGNIVNPGYDHITKLLTDKKSVRVRNSVCAALGRAFLYSRNPTVINELEKVAENDSDGQVRKTALESISLINKDREILEKIRLVKDEKQFIEEKLQFMETRITQI